MSQSKAEDIKRTAFLIGNSAYSDKRLSSLPAGQDVDSLYKVLADPLIGNYRVETSIDKPIQELREELENWFSSASKDELLLLYISGHGIKDQNGMLYFAATNTDSDRILSTGLPATFIHDLSENCRSKRQVFIFDTCFSGAFTKGYTHKAGLGVSAQETFQNGHGKFIITASDEFQYSWSDNEIQGSSPQSVFTRHLVKGLQSGEAANGESSVTAEQLFQYLSTNVTNENPSQKPQFWKFKPEGNLPLARNPVPPQLELPKHIGLLLANSDPAIKLPGLDELNKLIETPELHLAIESALSALIDDNKAVSTKVFELKERLDSYKKEKKEQPELLETVRQVEEEKSSQIPLQEEAKRLLKKENGKKPLLDAQCKVQEEKEELGFPAEHQAEELELNQIQIQVQDLIKRRLEKELDLGARARANYEKYEDMAWPCDEYLDEANHHEEENKKRQKQQQEEAKRQAQREKELLEAKRRIEKEKQLQEQQKEEIRRQA